MTIEIATQIAGWAGTVLFLIAYCLVTFKKIDPTSRRYQLLNLIGAFCLGANVFYQQAWPALALEIVWAIIAVVALVRKGREI